MAVTVDVGVHVEVWLGFGVDVSVGVEVVVGGGVFVRVEVAVDFGTKPHAVKTKPNDAVPLNLRKSRRDNWFSLCFTIQRISS